MAKKTILGIDIGHDQLKLALVKNGRVVRTASAKMPENLLKEGRITSRESMTELLRLTMKENGLRAGHGAFVLPNNVVFIKNVEMPWMTVDQLEYNLPFEFNDYITGELKDYAFDYAVLNKPEDAKRYTVNAQALRDRGWTLLHRPDGYYYRTADGQEISINISTLLFFRIISKKE